MDSVVWLLLAIFVLLDLFFAILRTTLLNVRAPYLDALEHQEPRRIERVLKTLERGRLRATFRVAMGLTHFVIAALIGWIVFHLFGQSLTLGATIGIFVLGMLVLFCLEFLVERFPLRKPELWAVHLSGTALILDALFTPLSALMIWIQDSAKLGSRSIHNMTEDELRSWVEAEQPEGGLEKDERRMIYSIFQFGDTLCREIMVPRIDVLALEVTTPLKQATDELIKSGHSRVPVYENSIDNIIGLLYAKDLLKVTKAQENALDLRKLLRMAYFVPESKKVDELLAEMQVRGVHMVIVVDEYGGMAGLVTLEDIVEEIVGEIRDEYDDAEDVAVRKVGESEFIFKGQVALDDVNEVLDSQLTAEFSDSLGGFIYGELGRVPGAGDTLQVGDWQFTVEDVRGHRIGKIRARKLDLTEQEKETEHGC